MNKLNSDNINFENDDFLIKVVKQPKNNQNKKNEAEVDKIKQEVQNKADKILQQAHNEAEDIIKKAKEEMALQKDKILQQAHNEAEDIIKKAKEKTEKQKEEIEQYRIEQAKQGYQEGHTDGTIKAKEELLDELEQEYKDKLSTLDDLSKIQIEIKEKVLKSLNEEIIKIIENIAKKIILKNIDADVIENIVKETIRLLEKKENINVTLSEEYAKNLFELQKRKLTGEIDFDFNNFNQYENFKISYSPKFKKDTIIVENLIERFDASIMSQLDVIINDIKNQNHIIKEDLENDFRKFE